MKKTINSMKITVYSLEGCSFCESLKSKLKELHISFTDIKCDQHESLCDTIENITNCETYPIIKIGYEYGKDLLLCVANNHNQLGRIDNFDNGKIMYLYSIDNMIDAINKL